MPTDLVRLERRETIATLSLNRPEKRNALNIEMWRGLTDALDQAARDADLRCLIVTGAGGHFAAGADMAEFAAQRGTPDAAQAYGEIMLDALWALRAFPLPTVARIEGNCLGGGLEIAAMCDLRIAASDAKFGIPIQRVGITMPYPELSALVDLLGRATMLEMFLSGDIFDADWAARRNLVTRTVAPADLDAAVTDLATKIASGSPQSHRNHKKFTLRCLEKRPLEAGEIAESYAAVEGADYREGIAAFLEKRRPQFTGT
ncbi:enoyl-CoA hydratase/isomerase family protein [Dongia sp.]|uniref:enoyl-CoA hydratase/isomerase family protein n=1 Tax=Dongia sp. TaxID=1977262 RepID=UPI0035AE21CF